MATAALAGLGWGALHALTGPDHVLSLAPSCTRRGAWRVGLVWGAGHALGTLAWAALALLAARLGLALLDAPWAHTAMRITAAGVLLVTGLVGWRRAARIGAERADLHAERSGTTLLVGALHGLTGAAAVLVVLPALASGAPERFGWLGGFAVGSTIAMAALTAVLGAGAVAVSRRALGKAVAVASLGSVALGVAWLVNMRA